jgi:hypothetical protein
MDERTGKSASTAAVLGTRVAELDSINGRDDFKEPPLDGFKPKIHARCCSHKWNVEEKELNTQLNIKETQEHILVM